MFERLLRLVRGSLAAPLLAFGLAACGGGGSGGGGPGPDPQPPPPPPWGSPDCDTVTGEPIASYSPDTGVTIVPNTEPIDVNAAARTTGIAFAHSYGGLLFAAHAATSSVYVSTDAGCRWEFAAMAPPGRSFSDVVGADRLGFVLYGDSTGSWIFRLNSDGSVDNFELPARGKDLATTPDDPGAVYALLSTEEIVRSGDQGETWVVQGTRPPTPDVPNFLEINPADALHFVVTGGIGGVSVSFDGGNSWMESTGILRDAQSGGTSTVAFGSDGVTHDLWVVGVRSYREGDQNISSERFIARSVDGGLNFEDVVMDAGEVRFNNHPAFATRPGVAGELMFTGIDCPFEPARLFHYRASDDSVTVLTYGDQPDVRGFGSIVFHPTDPDVLYVGHMAEGECPN